MGDDNNRRRRHEDEEYYADPRNANFRQKKIDARMPDAKDAEALGYTNLVRDGSGRIISATHPTTGKSTVFVNGQAPERVQLDQSLGRSTAPSYPSAAAARLDRTPDSRVALDRAGTPQTAPTTTQGNGNDGSSGGNKAIPASITGQIQRALTAITGGIAVPTRYADADQPDGTTNAPGTASDTITGKLPASQPAFRGIGPVTWAGTPADSAAAVRTMALVDRAKNAGVFAPMHTPAIAQSYASNGNFDTARARADLAAGRINADHYGAVIDAASAANNRQPGVSDASRAMMSGRMSPTQQQQLSREAQTSASAAYDRTHPGETAARSYGKTSQAEGLTIGPGGQTINGQFAPEGSTVTFDGHGKPVIAAPTSAPTQPAVVGAVGGGSIARNGVPQVNDGQASKRDPQGSFVAAPMLTGTPADAPAASTPDGIVPFAGFNNPALSPAARTLLTAASGATPFRLLDKPADPPPTAPTKAASIDPTIDPIVSGAKSLFSYAGNKLVGMQFGGAAASSPAAVATKPPQPVPAPASAPLVLGPSPGSTNTDWPTFNRPDAATAPSSTTPTDAAKTSADRLRGVFSGTTPTAPVGNAVYQPKAQPVGNAQYQPTDQPVGNAQYKPNPDAPGNANYNAAANAQGNAVYKPTDPSTGNAVYQPNTQPRGNAEYDPAANAQGNALYRPPTDTPKASADPAASATSTAGSFTSKPLSLNSTAPDPNGSGSFKGFGLPDDPSTPASVAANDPAHPLHPLMKDLAQSGVTPATNPLAQPDPDELLKRLRQQNGTGTQTAA